MADSCPKVISFILPWPEHLIDTEEEAEPRKGGGGPAISPGKEGASQRLVGFRDKGGSNAGAVLSKQSP